MLFAPYIGIEVFECNLKHFEIWNAFNKIYKKCNLKLYCITPPQLWVKKHIFLVSSIGVKTFRHPLIIWVCVPSVDSGYFGYKLELAFLQLILVFRRVDISYFLYFFVFSCFLHSGIVNYQKWNISFKRHKIPWRIYPKIIIKTFFFLNVLMELAIFFFF